MQFTPTDFRRAKDDLTRLERLYFGSNSRPEDYTAVDTEIAALRRWLTRSLAEMTRLDDAVTRR